MYLVRSPGDLRVIAIFGVLGARTQRQKSKFAPFPVDGELDVALTAIVPAHGSYEAKKLMTNFKLFTFWRGRRFLEVHLCVRDRKSHTQSFLGGMWV